MSDLLIIYPGELCLCIWCDEPVDEPVMMLGQPMHRACCDAYYDYLVDLCHEEKNFNG